jgi:hypothetical protein
VPLSEYLIVLLLFLFVRLFNSVCYKDQSDNALEGRNLRENELYFEIFDLLGFYAALIGNSLLTFRDKPSVKFCFINICVKTNKFNNCLFNLLIMYGSTNMFRHYIAIFRERS